MIFGDFLGSERKKVGGRSACQRHGGRCPTDHHHPTQRHLRRNAAIVLTCAGERTTFTVSQKQKDALLLTSDKVELDATTDVDWITQAPGTRGLVEKNLCFDIAPNEGAEARQGTITLSGGGVTQAITVRQEAFGKRRTTICLCCIMLPFIATDITATARSSPIPLWIRGILWD